MEVTENRWAAMLREVEKSHQAIRKHAESMVEEAIAIGEIMITIKADCEHGEFMKLIAEHTTVQQRQANRYMQAARHADKLMPNEQIQIGRPDHFTSLTNFLQFASDVELEQQIANDIDQSMADAEAGVTSINEGFSKSERAEYEDLKAHQEAIDKLMRDHEEEMAATKARVRQSSKERQNDPEYQKARDKAKWNWKQMAKQYTPDDRFMGLLSTPTFGCLDEYKTGFTFTDDELYEAFKAALIFGWAQRETKQSSQLLWSQSFEEHRNMLDKIRTWNEKIGMCLQRLDDEGFEIKEPTQLEVVSNTEGKKSA